MNEKPTFVERFKLLKFTRNLGLKIISLIIASLLWLFVVNITDPTGSTSFKNVPVKLLNTSVITDNNKTFEVLDDTDVISNITIKAPRTVIQELGNSADSIIAVADFNDLSTDGIHIPIQLSFSRYADKIESVRSSNEAVSVSIETRKMIQLPLTATTSGDIEDGYVLGNVSTAQNQVRVSGPESIISAVKKAAVNVEVTGFTGNISTSADVVLFNEKGKEIPLKNLDLNVESVRVDVEILATKRVPVTFTSSGVPSEGCKLTGEVTSDTDTIIIAGEHKVIDEISVVNVPATALNISGQTGNFTTILDISKYLPDGVRLGDPSFDGKATVTVGIEALKEQEISVYLKNISIDSAPDGFNIEWYEKEDYIVFELVGLKKDLDAIQLSDLDYRVDFGDYSWENDVTEFKPGVYALTLNLSLPDGVEVKNPVTVKVKLSEKKGAKK